MLCKHFFFFLIDVLLWFPANVLCKDMLKWREMLESQKIFLNQFSVLLKAVSLSQ